MTQEKLSAEKKTAISLGSLSHLVRENKDWPQPGIYLGISNEKYHSAKGLSKSTLDAALSSPASYRASYIDGIRRPETPAMLEGTLFHKLVLEPYDFDNEFRISPEVNKRTTAGKEAWKKFIESCERDGVRAIDPVMYSRVHDPAYSVMTEPEVKELMSEGAPEVTVLWIDPTTNQLCKCRPDWLRPDGLMIDLKKARSSRPRGFSLGAGDHGYHRQAAWYMRGLRALGVSEPSFIFLAAEMEYPFHWGTYEIHPDDVKSGDKECNDALVQIMAIHQFKSYSRRVSKGIQTIRLPRWAVKYREDD
ncbi:PD-(D/E)XK nuclease-like domain-containing protein [Ferrimonas balearica]|uniref:PD-(D/E)XK nuclease-like domain-containing protein n=1 Tax=Ferrimonas balearica TaxID=44012 RepID=UPI001F29EF52|nr:PD-(D/E)XK nuclease-like domain-containing protein [Ferrimonas balearica]MBY6093806.1 PD-(D/E)XK nuclease-like domain-containing protein [Ferrimonas balearica]